MTSKKGKQTRRKTPAAIAMPISDPEARAKCVFCDKAFKISELDGGYLNRLCPHCGKKITEEAHDELASSFTNDWLVLYKQSTSTQASLRLIDKKLEKHKRWWQKPYRYLLSSRRKKHLEDLARIEPLREKMYAHLIKLALNRYYLSEWYLLTRQPLSSQLFENVQLCRQSKPARSESLGSHSFIKPRYVQQGESLAFQLAPASSQSAGIIGEHIVFEVLRKQVINSNSALFRSTLLPNIYLPQENRFNCGLWQQIDCVLATRSCVFIIEIKRWNKHIIVTNKGGDLYTSDKKVVIGNDDDTIFKSKLLGHLVNRNDVLIQNERHASRFAELFAQYPYNKIFELLIFVNPCSFRNEEADFRDNLFVGSVTQAAETIIQAMTHQVKTSNALLTQKELFDFGDIVIQKYGDLNQKRKGLHIQRIKGLRAI